MKKKSKVKPIFPYCKICAAQLESEKYYRCTQCEEFLCCAGCFSTGNCIHPHAVSHQMVIIEPNKHFHQPIYQADWSISEEVLLLAALRFCGVGNWSSISHNWVSSKSPVEIREHYHQIYLESPESPLPLKKIIPKIPLPPPPQFKTEPQDSSPSLEKDDKSKAVNFAQLCGYMPFRHEWATEFMDDAESIVSDIIFGKDSVAVFEEKVQKLLVYNKILEQREKRTHVVEGWDIQESAQWFKSGRLENDEAVRPLVPIGAYYGVDKVQKIAKMIHYQRELKGEIEKLVEWGSAGVKSLDEGELYSKLKPLVVNGKIEEIGTWNSTIRKFKKKADPFRMIESQVMSPFEIQFCQENQIAPPEYFAYKDLLIRERTIRKHISFSDALSLVPGEHHIISRMFRFLYEHGLI